LRRLTLETGREESLADMEIVAPAAGRAMQSSDQSGLLNL